MAGRGPGSTSNAEQTATVRRGAGRRPARPRPSCTPQLGQSMIDDLDDHAARQPGPRAGPRQRHHRRALQRVLQPRAGWARHRLMGRYVLRRLLALPFLLLGIATVAFVIARLIPADPLASIVGERNMNNEAVVAAAEERWGLDGGIIEQYVRVPAQPADRRPRDVVPHEAVGDVRPVGAPAGDGRAGHVRAVHRRRRRHHARRRVGPPPGQGRPTTPPASSRSSARRCRCSGSG